MTTHSSFIRAIVWLLTAAHVFTTVPIVAAPPAYSATMTPWKWIAFPVAQAPVAQDFSPADPVVVPAFRPAQAPLTSARPRRPRRITPNRTLPHFEPVPESAVFSATPTDQEIFRARIFSEPLVPVMTTSGEENAALIAAVTTYNSNRGLGLAPFEEFLRDNPASSWRPSLLANLGGVYLQSGRPSKALQVWDAAWQATRNDTAPNTKAVADYALGNWLQLTMNMGNVPALEARLNEVADRDVGGAAGSKLRTAREGLWILQNQHDLATASGPSALSAILRSRAGTGYKPPKEIIEYHATPQGASLAEMQALAGRIGLRLQMAHASKDARVPVPSLVHFKTDHFSAVIEERGDRYRLRDAIFGGDAWVTRDALLEESSGYFLVREGNLGDGWRRVTATEAANVIGHCAPGLPDDNDPARKTVGGDSGGDGPGSRSGSGQDNRDKGPNGKGPGQGPKGPNAKNPNAPKPPRCGMPSYSFVPNRASLRIRDTPVGCVPPRGPSAAFELVYNQRELFEPQIFTFWNAGSKWGFDWLSYVVDEPGTSTAPIVHLRGGGRELVNGTTPHWRTGATLTQTSSSPIRYERRLQDGSIEVFAQSDGASSGTRRVFMTQIIDPQGQTLTFTYDSSLRLVAATDALGQVTVLEYEHPTDTLKLTSVTDPFGRSATFTYNSGGRLESITDVIGLTSSFKYGPSDYLVAMTTPYGTTAFRSDPSPASGTIYRMIEATDPLGGTERLEFHWSHTSISATAPSGQVPTGFSAHNANLNKYNTLYWDKRAFAAGAGDVSKATIWRWMISPNEYGTHPGSTNVPYSVKRPLESRVWYLYPGQTAGDSTVGTYDQPIKVARVLDDSSSQVWQATYNSIGNITSETDPLGRVTTYTYATNGIDLLEVKQAGGVNHTLATYSSYTSLHLPQTFVDAAGETYTYTYNSAGQLLTETNPLSETTTYAYDADGYLTSITGAVTGSTTTFTYDDYGRVETITDSDDYEVAIDYDALDRPTQITYPDGTHEDITYDKLDAIRHRDRLGRLTSTFYDPLRRVIATRDPLGRTITQQWGPDWALAKLIDAKGQSTTWERDVQGRVTREVRADGTTDVNYVYETTNSRLHTLTDPEDQVKTYTYALDDHLLSVGYTNENISTSDVTFTYDSNYPRLSTMVDGTGTTTYSYNAVGSAGALQVSSVDGPLTNDTITFGYDDLGRGTATLINGYGVSSRDFDGLGRMTEEENELGTFTYTYDADSARLATATYPNGQTSSYSYFGNTGDRRLQTIHHQTSGSATLSKFDYTYHAIGNILTWRQQAGSSAVMWHYGYDTVDQLTSAVKKSTDLTPSILKRYAYGYDVAGNRSVEQIDDAVVGASHNTLNRLTSQQPNGVIRVAGTLSEASTVTIQGKPATVSSSNVFDGSATIPSGTSTFTVSATDTNNNVTNKTYEVTNSGSSKSFTYDANGNMTSDGTRTLEWDAENRLTAVAIGSNRSEFSYDGLDRRVRILEKESGSTVRDARFIWIGKAVAEERLSTGVITRFFRDGEEHDGVARYVTSDHLGSIREVTDSSESVVIRNEYDPYGRRLRVAGSVDSIRGFSGHFEHGASALVLAPFRAYDPSTARWISEDPSGLSDGPNLYAYVGNSSIFLVDPSGYGAVVNPKNAPVSKEMMEQLNKFNQYIGCDKDVVITGGNRPASSKLGARDKSQHVIGHAADIYVPGQNHLATANQAADSGLFGGIGWYQEGFRGPAGEGPHVHVDLREQSARWGWGATGKYYKGYFPKTQTGTPGNSPCECK